MSQGRELHKLLQTIFQDGIVEPEERKELATFTERLPRTEVIEVFQAFLLEKWGEAAADNVITGQERALIGKILMELSLPLTELPHQAQMILRDHV